MRDIVLALIVMGLLAGTLRYAWLGVLLWTWLSVGVPHKLTYGFAHSAPFAAMAAAVTLVALFISRTPVKFPTTLPVKILWMFVVWTFITSAMAIHGPDSWDICNQVSKVMLMALVAMAVLHDEQHIRLFVWVDAGSIGFYGFKSGLYALATGGGGTMVGPGGFMTDNNLLGLSMIMTVPLLFYLRKTATNRWVRLIMTGVVVLTLIAVLGTYSRGAFLSLMGMLCVLWWRAKGRRLVIAIIVLCVAVALIPAIPDKWTNRMNTVKTYDQDTSAMTRVHQWITAINIANHRITGAGFQAYTQHIQDLYAPVDESAADTDHVYVAHSIYFQVLGQHGWIGLFLWLSTWLSTIWLAARVRRLAKGRPHLKNASDLVGYCQVAYIGFFMGGAFLSFAYADLQFNLMVIVVVTERWVQRNLEPPKPAAAEVLEPGAVRRVDSARQASALGYGAGR